jgi:hypothetical protein
VSYVDPTGQVTQADVGGLQGDTVTAVAAGGGAVAAGTDHGKVFLWTPGSGTFRQVGKTNGAVFDLATYGGNVLVLDDSFESSLIWANGQQTPLTQHAFPLGATMSSEYAVWAEATGTIKTGLTEDDYPFEETDLHLLSLATGKVYNLYPVPGQQGFPSISGRRLVWQDAALGGDDIFTSELPGGL